MEQIKALFSKHQTGGRFKPKNCIARHKVVIIPFHIREEYLEIFFQNIYPIL